LVLAVRTADQLRYKNREWFIKIFRDDPDDFVRGAALDWLLNSDHQSDHDVELRDLIIGEMRRAEPGYTAARAADEALRRWPEDKVIAELAVRLVIHLPKKIGGWRRTLQSALQRLGHNADDVS
jgi:hypothetical protein